MVTSGRAPRRSTRGARIRRLREALLAYLFLLPAFLIVGLFGLFPLIFAAYQSTLRGINKVVGTFDGLGNYVRAVDVFTYVLGFWGAVILVWLPEFVAGLANDRGWNEQVTNNAPNLIYGLLVVVVVLVAPGGLMGSLQALVAKVTKR